MKALALLFVCCGTRDLSGYPELWVCVPRNGENKNVKEKRRREEEEGRGGGSSSNLIIIIIIINFLHNNIAIALAVPAVPKSVLAQGITMQKRLCIFFDMHQCYSLTKPHREG